MNGAPLRRPARRIYRLSVMYTDPIPRTSEQMDDLAGDIITVLRKHGLTLTLAEGQMEQVIIRPVNPSTLVHN